MHLVESWQRPSSDDINPDALEYLFAQTKSERSPWLKVADAAPEPVARITPEYVRLQTRVEMLKGVVELTNEQLHEAHHNIGAMSAELARQSEALEEMRDYRSKAALTIAYKNQNEMLRARIQELEAAVMKLADYAGSKEIAQVTAAQVREKMATDAPINASNYVIGKPSPFPISMLAITTALAIAIGVVSLCAVTL